MPKKEQNEARDALELRGFRGESIPLDSPAAAVYASLRAGRTGTSDAGECQSIALASVDGEALFATAKTRAGWLGVIELEERARALPSLLREMVRTAGFPPAAADAVLLVARTRSGLHQPTWWFKGMQARSA